MIKALALALTLATVSLAQAHADTIKVGVQPWLGYGPLWVAEEKGFFKKHDLDVVLTTFNWDQDMTAALASENLNVIAAGSNSVITNVNQGVDQKGFLVMDLSYEADAILAGEGINSVNDLKGKTVAFEAGATSDLLLNYALKQNGMKLSDVKHVPMGASEAGLALIAGRVDSAVTYEPYISTSLKQGGGFKVIYTAAEKRGLISDMLTASSTWIAANPKDVQGLIRAWDDAVKFVRENPQEGKAIIAKAVGSSLEELEPAFAGVRMYDIQENQQFLKGEFQESLKAAGEIMHETNPDNIKRVPTADELLALEPLKAVAAQ